MKKNKQYIIIRDSGQSHGTFTDEKTGEVKEYAYTHLFCERVVENEKGVELSRSAYVEKLSSDTDITDIFFNCPVGVYYDKFNRVALCHMLVDTDSKS